MENILKIIYDRSISNKILNLNDIEKILNLLTIEKDLSKYISNMEVQQIRSKHLASYSNYTKTITIYSNIIDLMMHNIDKTLKITNEFEKTLYKNLSILQVIMHEVEHANQEKIIYNNNLESFILKLSELIDDDAILYEYNPAERLAEIKSYKEIILLLDNLNNKTERISSLINTDNIQRLLRGYHYKNKDVTYPLSSYFKLGNKPELLIPLGLHENEKKVISIYNLEDRFKYGFPITTDEYATSLNFLITSTNKYFKNRILINNTL